MDTGRFVLAIVLVIGVIIVTNILFPPLPVDRPGVLADSVAPGDATGVGDSIGRTAQPLPQVDSAPRPGTMPTAAAPPSGTFAAETVWVESDLFRYGISTAGGSIVSASLLDFESFTQDSAPVELSAGEPLVGYTLRVGENELDLRALPFVIDSSASDSASVVLRHQDASGRFAIALSYRFDPANYLVDVALELTDLGAEEMLLIHLPSTLAVNEIRADDDYRALAFVVNSHREGIRSRRLNDLESRAVEEGPLRWMALRNKYFLVAALTAPAGVPFGGLIAEPVDGNEHAARLTGTLGAQENAFAFRLYLGPQEYTRLAGIGDDLADVNPYGWKIFRPIVRPFAHLILWALDGMHDVLGWGYGWVLILFGVLVRLALWPLNAKAMRSQLKTMEIQPLLKEIQAKYKNDPERMQREVVRLYKEEGFNPLGGCLPLLLPMPILFTLFFVFQSTIAFRGEGFLWLPDLSQHDPLYVLPIVMGASIFLMQWLNLKVNPDPTPQMKMLTYFMPVMLTVLFLKFASGLNLYYAAQNIASLPQQLVMMRERKKFHRRTG
jgi:YidC/Oxa1 family membrane protein insertase